MMGSNIGIIDKAADVWKHPKTSHLPKVIKCIGDVSSLSRISPSGIRQEPRRQLSDIPPEKLATQYSNVPAVSAWLVTWERCLSYNRLYKAQNRVEFDPMVQSCQL